MARLLAGHPVAPQARRFARAALLGSIAALVLDVLMLSGGHAGLSSDPGILGGFYDAQARAMLDAKLAVDPALVGFEGFLIDGSTYVYFGPVPSILRMPVLLVTDGLDGRLTQLSMLLAFGVLLAAGARLHWQARSLVRPDAPAGRTDSLWAFLMAFTLGAGAVPLFLAARPVVYHETELCNVFSTSGPRSAGRPAGPRSSSRSPPPPRPA